ncbi:MAG TPA: GNAT family N-acetyltransferase [Actinomycetota bacterium]|nr:GNAT family N-acetyltransferase [Actinomycetota bacterium]
MSDISVRPFRPEDEPAVLELLRASLGGGPTGQRSEAFFRWKHVHNPFGRSFMLVAESGGSVIGLRAFMRWRFEGEAGTVRAVRAVDTATHPDFQGRGVFSRLTREALSALEGSADLVFNTPNEKSGPGYLKLGWRRVGRLPVSLRPRLRGLRPPAAGSGPPPTVGAPPAAEALADGDALHRLLEHQPDGRLRTPRDPEYLRWRYVDVPGLAYRAVPYEAGGRLRGLAIFRLRSRRRRWECSLAEVLVGSGDRATAGRLLRAVAAACPRAAHVAALFPPRSTPAAAARRRSFVRIPLGPTLMVRLLAREISPDPTARASWALSLGDVEVF